MIGPPAKHGRKKLLVPAALVRSFLGVIVKNNSGGAQSGGPE
jgi:hypothetical protein